MFYVDDYVSNNFDTCLHIDHSWLFNVWVHMKAIFIRRLTTVSKYMLDVHYQAEKLKKTNKKNNTN